MNSDVCTLTARICGGLGNQLFIYAAARAAARASGRHLLLDSRTGFERDRYRREYLLDQFTVDAGYASPYQSYAGALGRMRRWLHRRLSKIRPWGQGPVVSERGPYFDPELLRLPRSRPALYLEGYWQSPCYFQDLRGELLDEFKPRSRFSGAASALSAMVASQCSVCVHVRTYHEVVGGGCNWCLEMQYYKNAMHWMRERLTQPRFFVFSDRVEIARQAFRDMDNVTIVTENSTAGNAGAISDLQLMGRCRHFIINNSTFSWWAAWLADYEGKHVLTPDQPERLPNRDFFPKEWIKISVV